MNGHAAVGKSIHITGGNAATSIWDVRVEMNYLHNTQQHNFCTRVSSVADQNIADYSSHS